MIIWQPGNKIQRRFNSRHYIKYLDVTRHKSSALVKKLYCYQWNTYLLSMLNLKYLHLVFWMNKFFQLSFICTSFDSFLDFSDALVNDETELISLSIFFLFCYLCFFYFLITRIMFTYSSYLFISVVLHFHFQKRFRFSMSKLT